LCHRQIREPPPGRKLVIELPQVCVLDVAIRDLERRRRSRGAAGGDGSVTGPSWYGAVILSISPDEGAGSHRRAGPFWIEEGNGPLWVGAAIVAAGLGLYSAAVTLNGA
jgi:hypothetical protein